MLHLGCISTMDFGMMTTLWRYSARMVPQYPMNPQQPIWNQQQQGIMGTVQQDG